MLSAIPYLSALPATRLIPALSAFYMLMTFGITAALSVGGQAMARPEGLDKSNPREHLNQMRGLPQRLRSAHMNLVENFSAFALAAAFAQILAPADKQIGSLLILHVLLKCGVFYPAYLMDLPGLRGPAHLVSTGAVVNVCWILAFVV